MTDLEVLACIAVAVDSYEDGDLAGANLHALIAIGHSLADIATSLDALATHIDRDFIRVKDVT